MSKQLTKIIATGAIIATTGLFSVASLADIPATPLQPPKVVKLMKLHKADRHHHRRHGVAASWRHALRLNKHITKEQARTLTKAAIIMYGNPGNMRVGDIKPIKLHRGGNGYLITIDNTKGTLLKKIKMNGATGHVRPVRAHVKLMKIQKPQR